MNLVQTRDLTQPGWYPDIRNAAMSHYWSGTAWIARRVWTGTHWIDSTLPPPIAPAVPTATPKPESMGRKIANRAYLTLGGVAVAAIGCMMPWATQNYGFVTTTIDGTSTGGGQIDLVLALVVAGLSVLFFTGRTGVKSIVFSLVLAVLMVVICVANMVSVANVIDKEHAAAGRALIETGTATRLGAGILIVFAGGLIVVVGLVLSLFGARGARSTR